MLARRFLPLILVTVFAVPFGVSCGGREAKKDDFRTSGSRDADQRAEQRINRSQRLRGEDGAKAENAEEAADTQRTLYARLGGEQGIRDIVDDYVPRLLEDPRVNFARKGVTYTTTWTKRSAEWDASPANVERVKKHFTQFLSLATGGPAQYEGKDLKTQYKNLAVTNAEFDAAIGDLKSSLDRLRVPVDEQKELIAIVESTRPQIVSKR